MYRSEHGQDRWLEENVFKGKRNGVFFECGAIDGITTSNTVFFEEARNWSGLLVEANPPEFEKIELNRPKCLRENCALWDTDGKMIEFEACIGGLRGWSGVSEAIEPQHRERMDKNIPAENRKKLQVPTLTLQSVLNKHGLRDIDYCTLDIEGAEHTVLKAFPFHKFNIRIFDIEDNFHNFPIETLMAENGYKKLIRLGVSDIYEKVQGGGSL